MRDVIIKANIVIAKKVSLFSIILLICISVCGCAHINMAENTEWKMSSVSDKLGNIIFCSEDKVNIYTEAEVKNMTCKISDLRIHISDNDTTKKWEGGLKLQSKNNYGEIYDVQLGNIAEGKANFSSTEHNDGASIPTLVLSLDDYVIYFTKSA